MQKLKHEKGYKLPTTIIPLKKGDGAGSLIVLPDLGGNLHYMKKITCHLLSSCDVYGMRLDTKLLKDLPLLSLTGLAKRFANDLLASDLPRPFHLTGHSFAGFVAYETATYLELKEEDVGIVALLDAELPPRFYPQATIRWRRYLFDQVRSTRHHLNQIVSRILALEPKHQEHQEHQEHQVLCQPGFVRIDLSNLPEAYREIITQQYRAMIEYKPSVFKGKMILLRAIGRRWLVEAPPDQGWGGFSNVDIIPIAGGHLDLVREDQIAAEVARILQSRIECYKS